MQQVGIHDVPEISEPIELGLSLLAGVFTLA